MLSFLRAALSPEMTPHKHTKLLLIDFVRVLVGVLGKYSL